MIEKEEEEEQRMSFHSCFKGCWIMRQCGRYLHEYRKLKSEHSFVELCKTPELAAKCALLPLNEYEGLLDYAILFSDILFILEPLGFQVNFESNDEPVVSASFPITFIPRVSNGDFIRELEWIWEVIRKSQKLISLPFLGFSGSPLALLCYIVEEKQQGKHQKKGKLCGGDLWNETKKFLQSNSSLALQWLDVLTEKIIVYLQHQLSLGVAGIQIFDSTCFLMDNHLWEKFSWPFLQRISHRLHESKRNEQQKLFIFSRCSPVGTKLLLAKSEFDVISVDERIDLEELANFMHTNALSSHKILQGPFDPTLLFAPNALMAERIHEVCSTFQRLGLKFIVNLSNGILPETDEEKLRFFLQAVRRENYDYSGNKKLH